MAANINTEEIRKSARALEKCAAKAEGRLLAALKKASGSVDDALEGEAGNALRERLEGITGDARRSQSHLAQAAASMFRYADHLDAIDAKTSEMIKSR